MSDNKALDNRYADRFFAFIGNTTENECQADVLQQLMQALKERHVLKEKASLVDFGCGPGEMTAAFQRELRNSQPYATEVETYGLELNPEHAAAARANHGINIITQDIFAPETKVEPLLQDKEAQRLFHISHAGYYGFEGWTPEGTYKRANIENQPKIAALVENVLETMQPDSIAFFQHKAVETTNYLKRPHGAVVESDTNLAIIEQCEKHGMTVVPLQFHAHLNFRNLSFGGNIPAGLWQELENPPAYPESAFGKDGKAFRDVLEFLAHRGLEEMPAQERDTFLSRAKQLMATRFAEGRDGIDTYIQMNVVLSPDAPEEFVGKVREAVAQVEKNCEHALPPPSKNLPKFEALARTI
jgi:SAM-dependent methyltransferase